MKLIDADKLLENSFKNPISYNAFCNLVKRQMTVDAVPVRHGRWKHKKDLKQFFCDQCGEPSLTEDDIYFYGMEFPNFCPNCGADMRKGGDYEQTQKPE